jgi:leucyl aminopeptidase
MPSELVVRTAALSARPTGTVVVYAAEGAPPAGAGAALWAATGLDWARVSAAASFAGRQGQVLELFAPPGLDADRLLVLGAGKPPVEPPAGLSAFTDRGGSLLAKLGKADPVSVLLDGPDLTPPAVAEIAAGLKLRHYRFDKYKSKKKEDDKDEPQERTITLHVGARAAVDKAIAQRLATVEGALLARDLINEPSNVLGPVEFAAEIAKLAEIGLEIEILEPEELAKLGMNAMLAVAQGSPRPARLAVMQWRGGKADAAPVAFIGKGVCFDTGGISLKTGGGMEDMKGDMGGAAAVVGLLRSLAGRKAKVNAVGVVGLVENSIGPDAYRPGDIIKAMSGTTIEINNTDAEGRMVLADVLWYSQQRFKPRFMINLATLTGAIIMALGHDHAGLFSNNDELAGRLLSAGLATGEKLWRMPLGASYDKLIESRFADIKQVAGRPAGAIVAAQFLQRFVNDVPWAHLDIAGTAFGTPGTETNSSWASGFGVVLLDRLVRDHYEG